MITEIFGSDTFYSFELDGTKLTITFKGDSQKGVVDAWHDMKPSFETQLEYILRNHNVENVFFQGDKFGNGLFNLCRYECQSLLQKKHNKNYKIIEDSKMKMLYIEDAIFCTNRYGENCDNGLTIEVEAPLDTEFHFKRDEIVYDAVLKNGTVTVPSDFLTDGNYQVYAVKPGGLPTNVINMEVESNRKGKYISCKKDYDDLLDTVYKLAKAYYNTNQRLSAHIDGYEVI